MRPPLASVLPPQALSPTDSPAKNSAINRTCLVFGAPPWTYSKTSRASRFACISESTPYRAIAGEDDPELVVIRQIADTSSGILTLAGWFALATASAGIARATDNPVGRPSLRHATSTCLRIPSVRPVYAPPPKPTPRFSLKRLQKPKLTFFVPRTRRALPQKHHPLVSLRQKLPRRVPASRPMIQIHRRQLDPGMGRTRGQHSLTRSPKTNAASLQSSQTKPNPPPASHESTSPAPVPDAPRTTASHCESVTHTLPPPKTPVTNPPTLVQTAQAPVTATVSITQRPLASPVRPRWPCRTIERRTPCLASSQPSFSNNPNAARNDRSAAHATPDSVPVHPAADPTHDPCKSASAAPQLCVRSKTDDGDKSACGIGW